MLTASSCSTESSLSNYRGDGEIEMNPNYGIENGGGYTLKFKQISLESSAYHIYRFKGLPHLKAQVLFAIEDTRTWEDRRLYEWYQQTASASEKLKYQYACKDDLSGSLSMTLKDQNGNVIFRFNKKLSDLTWSRAGLGPWELYDEKTINFRPDGREYTIEVKIDSDPILKTDNGYLLIRGGGHEPISVGF